MAAVGPPVPLTRDLLDIVMQHAHQNSELPVGIAKQVCNDWKEWVEELQEKYAANPRSHTATGEEACPFAANFKTLLGIEVRCPAHPKNIRKVREGMPSAKRSRSSSPAYVPSSPAYDPSSPNTSSWFPAYSPSSPVYSPGGPSSPVYSPGGGDSSDEED